MKRILLLMSMVGLLSGIAVAQTPGATAPAPETREEGIVKWITFEQAVEKLKTEKRNLFIDVYTDWCGYCKMMDKNTFNEPHVAQLLNEKFYAVKFNAEQQEDVVTLGSTFKFIPYGNKGSHQLAMALLDNKMVYPTVVIMDGEFKARYPRAGYVGPGEFHMYLAFFSDDSLKKDEPTWKEFQKAYKSPF